MPMGKGTYGSKVGRPKKRAMYKKGKKVTKELTQRQKDTLKKHSVHHTSKHMTEMRKLMKAGKTFTQSHKMAMKKVGK
jgi:hypothetical protein